MKKHWYGLPLIGVLALGLNVGVVAADQPACPVATGSLPSPVHAVTVEPVAARTPARVSGFTFVKTINRPTPVLWQ